MSYRNSGRTLSHNAYTRAKSKEILVFIDGTGKNGEMTPGGNTTNVWKLYELAQQKVRRSPTHERILHYIPGIGSESKRSCPGRWLAQVYGAEIVEQVIRAYVFISRNYQSGDNVCIFGYSRGAFAARKVASLLYRLGPSKTKEDFIGKWTQREKPIPWATNSADTQKPIPVKCLGVWDTVGAVYSPAFHLKQDVFGIPDTELPANVENAFHVLAFHENRMRFRVTLFERVEEKTNLKEVWFPGSHSDVGGGGSTTTLPRISLLWMIGEMKPFLDIYNGTTPYPDVKLLKPSDAYNESVWKRCVDCCETRLASSAFRDKAKVHPTVKYADEAFSQSQKASSSSLLRLLDLRSLKFSMVAFNALEHEITRQSAPVMALKDSQKLRNRLMSLPSPIPSIPATGSGAARSPRSANNHPEWRRAIYVKNPKLLTHYPSSPSSPISPSAQSPVFEWYPVRTALPETSH